MDGSRFDDFAKALASSHSRRTTLVGLVAGIVAPLGALASPEALAAQEAEGCLRDRQRCGKRRGRKRGKKKFPSCKRCCSRHSVKAKNARRCAGRPNGSSCTDNRQCDSGHCRGGTCHATDYTVCPSGCQFDNLQAAIDAADPGRTIHLCACVFPGGWVIDKVLTLLGEGANSTTFDCQGAGPAFVIGARAEVVINGVTITDCIAQSGSGGGIRNQGNLTLASVVVTGNQAEVDGGGIMNTGTLVLNECSVTENSALDGGGIRNEGTATLAESAVSGNQGVTNGGGISNTGTLVLNDSTVKGNSALNGGGIRNENIATLTESEVAGNTATGSGGGIDNVSGEQLVLNFSFVADNIAGTNGGGISSTNEFATTTFMGGGSVTNNTASENGGGVYIAAGTLTIEAQTSVSGNNAIGDGGGIFGSGAPTISIADAGIVVDNNPNNCAGAGIPATCVG